MTSAKVVETLVTNNSSFQNYTHPDDHTTNYWYSWVQTIYCERLFCYVQASFVIQYYYEIGREFDRLAYVIN